MIVCITHAKVGYRHAIIKTKSPASNEDRAFCSCGGGDPATGESGDGRVTGRLIARQLAFKRKPRARQSAGDFCYRHRFVYRLSRLLSSGHDALFSEATQEAHEHFLAVDDIVEAVQA